MGSTRFGAPPTAKEFDSVQLFPRRALILVGAAIGAVMLAGAVGLSLVSDWTAELPSALVLSVVGILIIGVVAVYYPKASRGLSELTVDDVGLQLVRQDGRPFSIRWSDYRNRVLIVDVRSQPPEQTVPSLRTVEIVFNAVNLPVQGPISVEAVRAILKSAEAAGRSV